MELEKSIHLLESSIANVPGDLPEEMFLFITRITPMVNVDLLIKNSEKQTLLTWRDDGFYPPGWHVPGGIIRYKETMANRVHEVARIELGARVEFGLEPVAVNEVILNPSRNRGHFISLLFACKLLTPLDERLKCNGNPPRADQWRWHDFCPPDVIPVHEMYRKHMKPAE